MHPNNNDSGSSDKKKHHRRIIEGPDCLESTILKITGKNWLFSRITRSRWHEENNRLLFSVTGTDDQGLRKELRLEALFSSEVRIYKQCFFTDKLKSYWCTPLLFPTTTCEKYISSCCLSTKPIHSGTKWVLVHSCCASNWTKNAVKTYNF